MATSELQLTIKPSLSPRELDDVAALVREARWNQLAADWRIFLALGRVYALQSSEGRIVATTATLPYGTRFGWISMVLVAGEYRRRGLATRLMRRAMDDLDAMGLIADPRCHARRARRLPQPRLPGLLGLSTLHPPHAAARPHDEPPAGHPRAPAHRCRLAGSCAATTPRPSAPSAAPCWPACADDCPPPSSSPSARAASPASCSAATACERDICVR